MAPTETDLQSKAEQALQAAKDFSNIYYEHFDKKRHAIKNLYLDTANMVWSGTAVSGKDAIIKFLEDLPTSITSLSSLDAQPVDQSANENQTTILVTVLGRVKYSDSKLKGFYQTFLLSSLNNVWKIVTDNYRFMDVPPSTTAAAAV